MVKKIFFQSVPKKTRVVRGKGSCPGPLWWFKIAQKTVRLFSLTVSLSNFSRNYHFLDLYMFFGVLFCLESNAVIQPQLQSCTEKDTSSGGNKPGLVWGGGNWLAKPGPQRPSSKLDHFLSGNGKGLVPMEMSGTVSPDNLVLARRIIIGPSSLRSSTK